MRPTAARAVAGAAPLPGIEALDRTTWATRLAFVQANQSRFPAAAVARIMALSAGIEAELDGDGGEPAVQQRRSLIHAEFGELLLAQGTLGAAATFSERAGRPHRPGGGAYTISRELGGRCGPGGRGLDRWRNQPLRIEHFLMSREIRLDWRPVSSLDRPSVEGLSEGTVTPIFLRMNR